MKHLLFLSLSLIITGQAISQQTTIKVGTNANDGTGDNLRNALIKANQNDYNLQLTATASGTDTYTATISAPSPGYTTGITAPSAYSTGQVFRITFTNANTGAATLNINSLGAKSIVKMGAAALSANDIRAGQITMLVYDGTNLQIIGDGGSVSGAAAWGSITGTLSSQTDLQNALNAKVVDAINDGTTTTAPSQNAVYDALALESTITTNQQTDNYTLVLSDGYPKSKIVEISKATAVTLTVPTNASVAFATGTVIWVRRTGAGALTVAGADGTVTITGSSGALTDPGQNVAMILRKTGTNTWDLQNGVPGTWSAWTPTFTGFSTAPTGFVSRYIVVNKICTVTYRDGTPGTSNATSFTMTMPFAAKSGLTVNQRCLSLIKDNGTNAVGLAILAPGSNVLTFSATVTGGSFTASGNKDADFTIVYEID